MTRPLPKRTTRRARAKPYFHDADEILRRAEDVRTEPVRHCEVCGSRWARLEQCRNLDGYVCADQLGCWRRHEEARRVA